MGYWLCLDKPKKQGQNFKILQKILSKSSNKFVKGMASWDRAVHPTARSPFFLYTSFILPNFVLASIHRKVIPLHLFAHISLYAYLAYLKCIWIFSFSHHMYMHHTQAHTGTCPHSSYAHITEMGKGLILLYYGDSLHKYQYLRSLFHLFLPSCHLCHLFLEDQCVRVALGTR